MNNVCSGEHVMGNPGDILGDEVRYQRKREERQQAQERFERQWEQLLIAYDGDAKKAAGEMIARLAA